MLATEMKKMVPVWETIPEREYAIYVPSPLLLLMATENGWEIVRVEMKRSPDQGGFTYVVTLQSDSKGQCQELSIPRNALVDKILEQRGPRVLYLR